MTVSRALRYDPRVTPATTERVWRVAKEMGYRPNPMISSLMSSVRQGRLEQRSHIIAYLFSYPDWELKMGIPNPRRYYEGAMRRATELGFTLQKFSLVEPGMDEARVSQILCARNIRGVIVAPAETPGGSLLNIQWSAFASVFIGYSWKNPPLHRVANHHVHTMRIALEELSKRGYQRIGLALSNHINPRVDGIFSLGFLSYQSSLRKKDRLPPFQPPLVSRDNFLTWFRAARPDAVIGSNPLIVPWLREDGWDVPGTTAYVNLDYSDEVEGLAAVNQNSEYIGATAVETVAEQIYHNERGIPLIPKVVMIESEWINGTTV